MNLKQLKHQVYINKQGIKKPTDLFTLDGFLVVNKKVSRKYGFLFSGFITALITKYQALDKNERFSKKENKEFWYTEQDSKDDMGISYYMRKKLINMGIDLGLWKVEAKYNPNITGINKLDHFVIEWDMLVELIMTLDEKEDNDDVDDALEVEELEEEINDITIVTPEAEITDKDIEQYANEMSKQDGIKSSKSYMLELMDNATNPTRKKYTETRNKIKLWKKIELINKVDNYAPGFGDKRYEKYKDNFVYKKNIKYFIKGILEKDNQIHVAVKNKFEAKGFVMTFRDAKQFSDFREEYLHSSKTRKSKKNFDTNEMVVDDE